MGIDYVKEGRIAIFTINRPEVRNALDMEANRQISDAITDFRDDPELWVGVITGAGDKVFCAGADVKDTTPFLREHGWEAMPRAPWRGLELWKPMIAAINGLALGGGLEIALACDIRIASENARLGLTEVRVGVAPGGGLWWLPRAVPWCKAAEMVFMGRIIDAEEAYRVGLLNKVTSLEDLMPTAKEWAQAICEMAPLAVRTAKEVMWKGMNLSFQESLGLISSSIKDLLCTEDCKEGMRAFVEKRKPSFKGG